MWTQPLAGGRLPPVRSGKTEGTDNEIGQKIDQKNLAIATHVQAACDLFS